MNRFEPGQTEEKVAALRARYNEGQFSETVLRASFFALRFRGDDLDQLMRDTPPPAKRFRYEQR